MAASQPSARKGDWIRVSLTLIIVALYAIDFIRHGPAAAWHLIFLLLLGGPGAANAFVGFNLSGMQREGEREYYVRYAHLSIEEADRRIAASKDFASNIMALVLVLVELGFVLDIFSFDHPLSPSVILIIVGAFGAFFAAVVVFGVGYALWKLRHP